MAKSDFSCVETRVFHGFCHRAFVLQAQVPKLCTDLDLSLLYILILGTYSKFARKINCHSLAHDVRAFPSALADRSDLSVMLITRLSKADQKNRPGRSPTICRRFAELSDLRESKWDPEISWEIQPRYWKVFSKNRNNFRKESFSPNLIDNQSSLWITKIQSQSLTIQHTGTIVVPVSDYR